MTQLPLTPDMGKKVKRLTLKEQHALNGFIEAEYVKSKLTDVEFAEKAATFLNLPGINARHVSSSREIFEIPSNRDVERAGKHKAPAADFGPIEKRLETLEAQVRKLFSLTSRESGLAKIPSDNQIIKIRADLYKAYSAESGDFRAIELVRRVLKGDF